MNAKKRQHTLLTKEDGDALALSIEFQRKTIAAQVLVIREQKEIEERIISVCETIMGTIDNLKDRIQNLEEKKERKQNLKLVK